MKRVVFAVVVLSLLAFLTSAKPAITGFARGWEGTTSSMNNVDSDFFFGSDLAIDFVYNAENYGYLAHLWGNSQGSKVFGDSDAVDFSAYGWVAAGENVKVYLGTLPSYRYDSDLLLDAGNDLNLYWIPGVEVEYTGNFNLNLFTGEWSNPYGTSCLVFLVHATKAADALSFGLTYYGVDPHASNLDDYNGFLFKVRYNADPFTPYFAYATTNGKSGFGNEIDEKYAYRLGFDYTMDKGNFNLEYAYVGAGADVGTSAYSNLYSVSAFAAGLGGAIKGYSLVRATYEMKVSDEFKWDIDVHYVSADTAAGYVGDDSIYGVRLKLHYSF